MQRIQEGRYSGITIIILGLLIGIPLGMAYQLFTGAPLMGCITGCFCVVAATAALIQDCDRKSMVLLVLFVAVKFLLAAYQAKYKSLPMGGEDWFNYHSTAQSLLENSRFPYYFFGGSDLFSKLVAFLYDIFGVHTLYINLFILASSIIATRFVFKTTILITDGDYPSAFLAMLVFFFWPIDVVYSVTYLREMPIQMFTIVAFYYACRYVRGGSIWNMLLALIMAMLASMMHSGVLVLIPVFIIFLFQSEHSTTLRIVSTKTIMPLLIALVLLIISPLWEVVSAKLGDISSTESLVSRSQQFWEGEANTRYISEMPKSFAGFVFQVPWRAVLFALVPFPWMVYDFNTGFAWAVDALPQIWIWYRLIRLNKMTFNHRTRVYYVMTILLVAGTYAVCGMGTTAYGNAIRHRAKIVPIILAIAVGLYSHLQEERNKICRD